MKAYISVSYQNRKSVEREINVIINTLWYFNISAVVFVDEYKFIADQEQEMMSAAMAEIDNCDILLAETSDKGIGIGIEVGYAKAKGKRVVYLRHATAEHSTTVSGMSDFQVVYQDIDNLKNMLSEIVVKLAAGGVLTGSDSKSGS